MVFTDSWTHSYQQDLVLKVGEQESDQHMSKTCLTLKLRKSKIRFKNRTALLTHLLSTPVIQYSFPKHRLLLTASCNASSKSLSLTSWSIWDETGNCIMAQTWVEEATNIRCLQNTQPAMCSARRAFEVE